MKFYCPYCKTLCKKVWGDCFNCNSHAKDYYIAFYVKDNLLYKTILVNKYIKIRIKNLYNIMEIIRDYEKILSIPIDPNITPENLEQKIKTYLSFL